MAEFIAEFDTRLQFAITVTALVVVIVVTIKRGLPILRQGLVALRTGLWRTGQGLVWLGLVGVLVILIVSPSLVLAEEILQRIMKEFWLRNIVVATLLLMINAGWWVLTRGLNFLLKGLRQIVIGLVLLGIAIGAVVLIGLNVNPTLTVEFVRRAIIILQGLLPR